MSSRLLTILIITLIIIFMLIMILPIESLSKLVNDKDVSKNIKFQITAHKVISVCACISTILALVFRTMPAGNTLRIVCAIITCVALLVSAGSLILISHRLKTLNEYETELKEKQNKKDK